MTEPGAIHPISRPPVDPKFHHAAADRLAISEVAQGEPGETNLNSRSCSLVCELFEPVDEGLFTIGILVIAKFDHCHRNL